MDGGFKKFFRRKKSVPQPSHSSKSFQQTSDYGSLPQGSAPQVGSYPIKPSELKQKRYGHIKTKSTGQGIDNLVFEEKDKSRSRTKSLSGLMSTPPDFLNRERRNSMTTRGANLNATSIPPVPKLPLSLQTVVGAINATPKHLDLFHAFSADDLPLSPSDPYNSDIAARNSARNEDLEKEFKRNSTRSSLMYSENVADRNIRSSDGQRSSFEVMRAARDASMDSRNTASATAQQRVWSAHPQLQSYEPSTLDHEQLQHPPKSRTVPSLPAVPKVPNQHSLDENVFEDRTGSIRTGQSRLRHQEPSMTRNAYDDNMPNHKAPKVSPSTANGLKSPHGHRKAKSSVTSMASVPSSSASSRRHRRGFSGEYGSYGSDISELDDLDYEIAEAVPAKADPIQVLRASIVGADGYVYKASRSNNESPITPSQSPPSTAMSKAGHERNESIDSINLRAHRAVRRKGLVDSNRGSIPSGTTMKTASNIKRNEAPNEEVRTLAPFNMQTEFENLARPQQESDQLPITPYSSNEPAIREEPVRRDFGAASLQRRGKEELPTFNGGTTPGPHPEVRDFAAPEPVVRTHRRSQDEPVPTPYHSANEVSSGASNLSDNSESESAMPPTISRHRISPEAHSARKSKRGSSDFIHQLRKSHSRDSSVSSATVRARPRSISHILKATIDDAKEAAASDNGYSVVLNEEKWTRSLTLAALARTPLDSDAAVPGSVGGGGLPTSHFNRLKEQLASLAPVRSRSRNNSLTSQSASSAAAAGVSRPWNGSMDRSYSPQQSQSQPLRQYRHMPSTNPATNDDLDDDDYLSARSSFEDSSTVPAIFSPTREIQSNEVPDPVLFGGSGPESRTEMERDPKKSSEYQPSPTFSNPPTSMPSHSRNVSKVVEDDETRVGLQKAPWNGYLPEEPAIRSATPHHNLVTLPPLPKDMTQPDGDTRSLYASTPGSRTNSLPIQPSLPYHRVPPRLSSLKKREHHRSRASGGDYFGPASLDSGRSAEGDIAEDVSSRQQSRRKSLGATPGLSSRPGHYRGVRMGMEARGMSDEVIMTLNKVRAGLEEASRELEGNEDRRPKGKSERRGRARTGEHGEAFHVGELGWQ